MQKHIQHNKDERTQFFRKIYLSLYSKGFERVAKGIICERWIGDWKELQHIYPHPTLLAITAFLSRSPGLLNRWLWGPASARTWFSFQHLVSNWSDFLSYPGYIIIWHPPASCGVTIRTQFYPSTVKVIPRYVRLDAPVIYTGAFLIWQLGRVGGQYLVNIYYLYVHKLKLNIFKGARANLYCCLLIILLYINHLFAKQLNGFNYYYVILTI